MPDEMLEMYKTKAIHPEAGANCAWVPSPTAAALHAIHYHEINIFEKQKEGKIIIHWNYIVDEILGDESGVNAIRIINPNDNKEKKSIDLFGVFIAIGHRPNTSMFKGQLDMKNDYIKIKSGLNGDATASNVPGVFAVGDVSDQVYRQAITSAGAGCMGALDAEKYLDSLKN